MKDILAGSALMAPCREFPWGLLPLMLVPATLLAHAAALLALRRPRATDCPLLSDESRSLIVSNHILR